MHPDNIFTFLNNVIDEKTKENFKLFIERMGVSKWTIASDFVIGDKNRFNDTLVFTIFPHLKPINELLDEIKKIFPKDIKHTREISDEMLNYLKSTNIFSFCFIIDKNLKLIPNQKIAQEMINESIKMMENWKNSDQHKKTIAKFKALKQKSKSNKFSRQLIEKITLVATFAAFIFYLILKNNNNSEIICWAPDRDKMISAYGQIIHEMLNINFASLCQKFSVNGDSVKVMYLAPALSGTNWYDELIRIPDFIAGATSAWKIRSNQILAKYRKIVENYISDNPNIIVILVDDFDEKENFSRVITSKNPLPTNDNNKLPINF